MSDRENSSGEFCPSPSPPATFADHPTLHLKSLIQLPTTQSKKLSEENHFNPDRPSTSGQNSNNSVNNARGPSLEELCPYPKADMAAVKHLYFQMWKLCIIDIDPSDIVAKFDAPSQTGTARTASIFTFNYNFNSLTVK
ncbi:hypothetical protein ILUMI_23652 [Ignelater luminosus]|uniref:Uncharacterized protein n=1 Tax=Ignelater luminosus TaxID=2038154 RepID=A0A8K0CBN7_IGNLU|nr:hypothetical protein ILUMI_23652 [Ignelater luminosus]